MVTRVCLVLGSVGRVYRGSLSIRPFLERNVIDETFQTMSVEVVVYVSVVAFLCSL